MSLIRNGILSPWKTSLTTARTDRKDDPVFKRILDEYHTDAVRSFKQFTKARLFRLGDNRVIKVR
jgi:hypothetical protein